MDNLAAGCRIHTFDAMRGAAALVVVLFHIGQQGPQFVASGYLAVDFFFVLSGFVIQNVYRPKLAAGMSQGEFFRLRFVRLYPLHFLGLIIGLVLASIAFLSGKEDFPALATLLLNAMMLPSTPDHTMLFPFNAPGWSLMFEAAANAIFAVALVRLAPRPLLVTCIILALVLIASVAAIGTINVGYGWRVILPGIPRSLFSFTAGMVVADLVSGQQPRRVSRLSLLPVVLMPLVIFLAVDFGGAHGKLFYELPVVLIIFPLLVLAAFRYELPDAWRAPARFFGDLSYPLYAVHLPLVYFMSHFAKQSSLPAPVVAATEIALLLLVAHYVARWYDVPVRHWLTGWLRGPRQDKVIRQPGPVVS